MYRPYKLLLVAPLLCTSVAFADSALSVKNAGKPAKGMQMKSSKVPTYQMYEKKKVKGKVQTVKVKDIPRLNIGTEREVQAATVTPLRLPASQAAPSKDIRRRKSPPMVNVNIKEFKSIVGKAKTVTSPTAFDKIPEIKSLNLAIDAKVNETQPNLQKIEDLQPNDYKLLQALIFLEIQENNELALGLFAELINDPKHKIEALYQFALTAKNMGLNSEFREYMVKVTKEAKSKDWQVRATEALANNIKVLEISDIEIIDPLVAKHEVDVSKNEDYQITRAKYYSDKGQLGQVEEALMMISEKSPRYPEALMLSALLAYRTGKVDEAIVHLDALMKATDGDKSLPLRSIGAMTLARIQFQKSDYKGAFQTYLLVDKSNALWLQARVESAWTQILSEDYEGAAGNMFSLHTDFFKNAFAPESYVVRTVGYLNLCQYGDGAQVLNEMKKRYAPWKGKLDTYRKQTKQPVAYYETVKNWLKNSDLKEVDGLPRSFIVELARHPSFVSIQKQINAYEDETNRYNKIAMSLVTMERELIAKQSAANQDLAKAKAKVTKDKVSDEVARQITQAERKLLSYRIQYHIAKKARTSIKKLRTDGLARIEKEKGALRVIAAKSLQTRFGDLLAGLNKVLDQNDVLQYELYAGAGEHIRYQMAGGDINPKDRPELKVEKDKSLNWKFKGEIWEDEVGHYRSSLKNVCAQESSVAGLAE